MVTVDAAPLLSSIAMATRFAAPRVDAASEDALIKGRGAADGCYMESMAYLFVQARHTLFEGDGMSGAIVDAGEGQLFCTGPGRLLSVSERDTRRARALVEEEVEKTDIKRSKSLEKPFDDVPDG